MKLLLELSFIGTNYCGFQAQPSGNSIQQTIGRAAEKCFGAECTVTGCSRTDAGVHANRYYAALGLPDCANRIPIDRVGQAMNRFLPYDISVNGADEVSDGFHPRYSAHIKEYVYLILNRRTRDPFYHMRAYHYPIPLDASLMDREAKAFVGRHDFKAFMASGSDITDTVREVKYCNVAREGDLITMTVAADGFLYNMVRIMAGTLVYGSEGKTPVGSISGIIGSRDRSKAGATLPAHGLYLNRVMYGM